MASSQLLVDLFQAYYGARQNKRGTISALAFEVDYEQNLLELYQEIMSRQYRVRPSFCFVSKKPVLREVFAADFRDRVVHHLVYNYISPYFERLFIPDSYSCRKGRGTSYGIKRLKHFIRSCSRNYQEDCYILKLDISGYFMSIDRVLLYAQVDNTLLRFKDEITFDLDLILYLICTIIFHNPTIGCVIKGSKQDWVGLPKAKSLFWAKPNCGLPIGNLTSQLFGNVYLNEFDHFIKYHLGCAYYGRYVDDFVIVHSNKAYLKSLISTLSQYLSETIGLELHKKKIYLQHHTKGVPWLGVIIKPYRTYVKSRTKGNLYGAIQHWNALLKLRGEGRVDRPFLQSFLSTFNSYLGILQHCDAFRLRQKALARLDPRWRRYVLIPVAGPLRARAWYNKKIP